MNSRAIQFSSKRRERERERVHYERLFYCITFLVYIHSFAIYFNITPTHIKKYTCRLSTMYTFLVIVIRRTNVL